jgi:hypothetical protein
VVVAHYARLMGSNKPDLGAPSSYLVAAPGLAVISSDGVDVGRLEHVVADNSMDVFEGIVLASHGGEPHRFVDRDDIKDFYDRGVLLSISAEEIPGLHLPSDDPAGAGAPEHMHDRLRRAWDLVSGK